MNQTTKKQNIFVIICVAVLVLLFIVVSLLVYLFYRPDNPETPPSNTEPSIWAQTSIDLYNFEQEETLNGYKLTGLKEEAILPGEYVILPTTYNEQPVTSIGANAFSTLNAKGVVIPTSVKLVEQMAFAQNTTLEVVGIGMVPEGLDFVSAVADEIATIADVVLDGLSFAGCTSLKSIYGTDSVLEIGAGAFMECSSLQTVEGFNNVTELGISAFERCSSLQTVEGFDSLERLSDRAFYFCENLASCKMNNVEVIYPTTFDSAGVIIDNLQENLPSFKYVYFEDSGILDVSTFSNNTDATFGLLVANTVTNLTGGAFQDNTNITSIVFEENSQISTIEFSCFSGCTNLKEINLPATLTSFGTRVFANCPNVEVVNYDIVSLSQDENIFEGVGVGGNGFILNIGPSVQSIPAMLCSAGDLGTVEMMDYVSPNMIELRFSSDTICSSIGDYAFCGISSLEIINLPSTLTSIGSRAFNGCTNVKEINYDVPNLNSPNAIFRANGQGSEQGLVFNIGPNVQEIPDYLCASEVSVYSAPNIRQLNFAENSILTRIGNYAFRGIGRGMYGGDIIMETVVLPQTLIEIGESAFSTAGLTEIVLNENLTTIGAGAFWSCVGLIEITLPSTITSLGNNFLYGSSITKLTLTNGIESFDLGDIYACDNLEEIVIPASVTSITGSVTLPSLTTITLDPQNTTYTLVGNQLIENETSDVVLEIQS